MDLYETFFSKRNPIVFQENKLESVSDSWIIVNHYKTKKREEGELNSLGENISPSATEFISLMIILAVW